MSVGIKNVKYTGGVIKDFTLNASVKDGSFKLHNMKLDFANDVNIALSDVYSQIVEQTNVLVGNLSYSGKDLASQIALTNIPDYLQVKPDTNFSFTSKVILAEQELTFYGINAAVGSSQITGRWTTQTHNPERNKYNINLEFDNLTLDAFKAEKFTDLARDLFNNSNQKNYYANFVPMREITTNALLKLTLNNTKLGSVVIDKFYSEINISPAILNFKNTEVVAPFAKVKGDIQIISNALRPILNANLTGEVIDSDAANEIIFGIKAPAKPEGAATATATVTADNADKAVAIADTTATAKPVDIVVAEKPYWSMDKFQYFRIDKFDGVLNLNVNKFIYNGLEFDNLILESRMRENVWYIDYIKGNIFKGNLLAKGSILRVDEQLTVTVSAALNNFVVEEVTVGGDSLKSATGKASVSGSFYMVGRNPYEFMNTMNSSINFALRAFKVDGMDVNKLILISAKAIDEVDKDTVLYEVDRAYKTGSTFFSAVDGQLSTLNGVMETKNVTFATPNSNGYLSSSVDIRYFISNSLLEFVFKPKISDTLTLKFQLQGPYHKLVKAVDDKDYMHYIRYIYGLEIPKPVVIQQDVPTEFIYQKIIN